MIFFYTVCLVVGLLFTIVSAVAGHFFGGHDGTTSAPAAMPRRASTTAACPAFPSSVRWCWLVSSRRLADWAIHLQRHRSDAKRLGQRAVVRRRRAESSRQACCGCSTWFSADPRAPANPRWALCSARPPRSSSPIPENGVGEIAYVQGGSRYTAPARSENAPPFRRARPCASPASSARSFTSSQCLSVRSQHHLRTPTPMNLIPLLPPSKCPWIKGDRRRQRRRHSAVHPRWHLGQPLHQGRPEPGARHLRPQTPHHRPRRHRATRRLPHRQRRRHVRLAGLREGGPALAGTADHRRANAGCLYEQRRAGAGGRRGADQGQGRRHLHRHRRRAVPQQEPGRDQEHRHADARRPPARDPRHDDGRGDLPEPRRLRLEGPGSGRRRHGQHGPGHRQLHHPRHPRQPGLPRRPGQAAHRPGQTRRRRSPRPRPTATR